VSQKAIRRLSSKPVGNFVWSILNVGSILALSLAAMLAIVPMFWMFTGSLKTAKSTFAMPPEWIPTNPTLNNYTEFLTGTLAPRWFLNSLIIATAVMILTVAVSSLAGYAFSKKRFPGDKGLFWLLMTTMMMPLHVTLIPLFMLLARLQLLNTYPSIIFPMVNVAFGMFMMRQFMISVPSDLLDAAKIDGCGELRLFWQIMLPLSLPAVGALAIITFMNTWNNYLWQLIAAQSTEMFTLPIGIMQLTIGEVERNYGMMMAGASLAAAPLITVFLLFQRTFVKGLTLGSVKG